MAINDKIKAVKNFFMKSGKRNLIIACAVVLIGVAVWANWLFFSNNDDGFDYSGSTGMSGELDNSKNPTSGEEETGASDVSTDSYFSTMQVSRQRSRDEALEVLYAIIDNANATEEVKAEAAAEVALIAESIQQEAYIEAAVGSQGYENCVAVVSNNTVSVVVQYDGKLSSTQLAQINSVVYEYTGVEPVNITIITKA